MKSSVTGIILAKAGRVREGLYALLASTSQFEKITQFEHVQAAVQLIAQEKPELVLIEMKLVCTELQNFLDQIKSNSPQTKSVVVVENHLQQQLAQKTSVDEVLMKGFRTERLIRIVDNLNTTLEDSTTPEGGSMILETQQLTKTYDAGQEQVHALRSVDFQAEAGDFIVVNGPSGSGKTTFLNMVSLIDLPTSGDVLIEGQSISQFDSSKLADMRRDKIGLVFQAFNLIPVLSVYENIEYPMLLKGVDRKERYDKVMQLIEEVDLMKEANRRPDQLSGGQKQRVALARALVNDPVLFLADEPTGNLDTKTSERVMDIMKRLNEERKVTFIVVTHDLEVNNYANRVIHIRDGQLSETPIEKVTSASFQQKEVSQETSEIVTPKEGQHVVTPSAA